MLLRSRAAVKPKPDADPAHRSEPDKPAASRPPQPAGTAKAVDDLKADKKRLGAKIVSLSGELEAAAKQRAVLETELKQENARSKYFEDLYKEEREKNLDLQKQFADARPSGSATSDKKHARPISASKHGRLSADRTLAKVQDQVIDEQAELDPEDAPTDDRRDQPQPAALTFKDVRASALAARFRLQHQGVADVGDLVSAQSVTADDLAQLLRSRVGLTDQRAVELATFVFGECVRQTADGSQEVLASSRSVPAAVAVAALKNALSLQAKIEVPAC